MADKIIGIASVIEFKVDGTKWRVFYLLNGICRMINLDSFGFMFKDMKVEELLTARTNGEIEVYNDYEMYVVDKNKLTDEAREKYNNRLQFADEVRKLYGPLYTVLKSKKPKPEFKELLKKYGISKANGEKIIAKWLQSGLQDSGLLDGKYKRGRVGRPYNYTVKTGKKPKHPKGVILNDYWREIFDYAMKYYKKSRITTLHDCFVDLVESFCYVEVNGELVKLPPDQMPTEKQFINYVNSKIAYQERQEIKTSVTEYRNNQRLLFGDARHNSQGPGDITESDALEMDLTLVSSLDPTRVVGRADVYFIVDVFSGCITGFSVGFENNSVMALTNLFIDFFTPPEKIAERFGVTINPELYPSCFIPNRIRCDRGSDFKSDQFEEVCRQLNINRELCPGAMGSMKGMVEQSFRSFHNSFKSKFEHKGYIQKRYDSNHMKEAMYTVREVNELVLLFVGYHNSRYIKDFKLTKDMIEKGVTKTPISIWKYGIEKYGAPYPVEENRLPQIMMTLLPNDTATISREGLIYRGLYYIPFGDPDLESKMKIAKINARMRDKNGKLFNDFDIKYDPRSVNTLYYIKDGKVMQAILNPQKSGTFKDLTWAEYNDYRERESEMDANGEEANLELDVQKNKGLRAIVDSVQKVTNRPSTKNIREIREREKQEINASNAVSNFIPTPEIPVSEVPDSLSSSVETEKDDTTRRVEQGTDVTEEKPVTIQKPKRKNQLSSDELPEFFKNF